jgi:hypothetical protein
MSSPQDIEMTPEVNKKRDRNDSREHENRTQEVAKRWRPEVISKRKQRQRPFQWPSQQ